MVVVAAASTVVEVGGGLVVGDEFDDVLEPLDDEVSELEEEDEVGVELGAGDGLKFTPVKTTCNNRSDG